MWIFEPDVIQSCVHQAIRESTTKSRYRKLTDLLASHYCGQIETTWKWYILEAAGFVQPTCILHVSLREYIVLTGSAVPTTGFDGPYRTNELFDYIVEGEICVCSAGDFASKHYGQGDMLHTPKSSVFVSSIMDHCWNIEYARGNVLGMLPVPIVGTYSSTMDLGYTARMLCRAGAIFIRQWRNRNCS